MLFNTVLFTGNANRALAQEMATSLGVDLGKASVGRFSDGEVTVEIRQNVRARDVFVVQPTCAPVNEYLMELLIMVDAMKRASARRITAVIPYFGYARQDRRPRSTRVPISAKVVANLLETVGVERVLTMDLHADQIQGFFDIPVDNIYASPVLLADLKSKSYRDLVVVSPDVGGVVRARALAKQLGCDLAIIDKRRPSANVSEVMHVIGEIEGRNCVIMDDMIDTAGTLVKAAEVLKERGAKSVYAYCTHAVFSGPAIERIAKSALDEVVITNTIPLSDVKSKNHQNLVVVSPDIGGVVRARALAKQLGCDLAIIDKRRPAANVSEVMHVIGEIEGRNCVIMDDMIDTAGTLVKAAEVLKERGARSVYAYCTHPVFSGPAIERIAGSKIDEVVITNTIPLRDAARACPKIRQLSVAFLFAETIRRISDGESVTSLFSEQNNNF